MSFSLCLAGSEFLLRSFARHSSGSSTFSTKTSCTASHSMCHGSRAFHGVDRSLAKLPRHVTTSAAASSLSSTPFARSAPKMGSRAAGRATSRSRSRKVSKPSLRSNGTEGRAYCFSMDES